MIFIYIYFFASDVPCVDVRGGANGFWPAVYACNLSFTLLLTLYYIHIIVFFLLSLFIAIYPYVCCAGRYINKVSLILFHISQGFQMHFLYRFIPSIPIKRLMKVFLSFFHNWTDHY